jgi:hypothetical protein
VREERISALPAATADEAAAPAAADEAAAPAAAANEAAATAATTDDCLAGLSHDRQSIAESVSAAIKLKVNSHPTIT